MGIGHVVDPCSGFYKSGEVAGFLHGLATGIAGALNGGARTVLYSGRQSREIAAAGKGAGIMLDDTLGGRILFGMNDHVAVPDFFWRAASAVFSANAKGDVLAFVRYPLRSGASFHLERRVINAWKNARLLYM